MTENVRICEKCDTPLKAVKTALACDVLNSQFTVFNVHEVEDYLIVELHGGVKAKVTVEELKPECVYQLRNCRHNTIIGYYKSLDAAKQEAERLEPRISSWHFADKVDWLSCGPDNGHEKFQIFVHELK